MLLIIGKPSISMGHLYHGYVSHNQMVIVVRMISSSRDVQIEALDIWAYAAAAELIFCE
jgi:hypothetical protein